MISILQGWFIGGAIMVGVVLVPPLVILATRAIRRWLVIDERGWVCDYSGEDK